MKLKIIQGNTLEEMPKLESASVDMVLTSPPYWGMRSYGVGAAELGAEPTMEAYLDNMMRWVREAWRVLKPSGSFVLNLGDCFIGGGRGSAETRAHGGTRALGKGQAPPPDWKQLSGIYKPKQLLSVSSFAYCRIVSETDFVCRGEHIWAKPNVPSPIRSRLKHSHEKLFWFVKNADKYYFDEKPWLRDFADSTPAMVERAHLTVRPQSGYDGQHRVKPNTRERASPHLHQLHNWGESSCFNGGEGKKYKLNIKQTIEHSWRIVPVGAAASGFELAGRQPSEHIAPFPEALIRPYVQSLCPQGGVVLDPFLGSGTTMRVALEERRDCIGIELSAKSIAGAKKRLNWGQALNIEFEEAGQNAPTLSALEATAPANGGIGPVKVSPKTEVE